MIRVIGFIIALVFAMEVSAQERRAIDAMSLSPADCALINKRTENEFYVKGPVKIGIATISESSISRNANVMDGIDIFDVIQRSCYNRNEGKPT